MDSPQNLWLLLQDSLLLTFRVSLFFFGGILGFGLLLYLLARFTRNLFAKSFGSRAEIYITAWIGTPVHELGHAIFCVLFLHKIRKITLFNPNSKDGSLGSVEHSFNSRNLYHRIGNFFIGTGPLFFGSLVILAMGYWLLPQGNHFMQSIWNGSSIAKTELSPLANFAGDFMARTYQMLQNLFSQENVRHWQFWLFMYLSLAISTHMELSPPDLKQMWSGLVVMLLLIFVFNFIYLLFFSDFNNLLLKSFSFVTLLDRLLLVGLVFSAFNFLLTWIVTTIYNLLFHHKIPNPFTR